MYLAARKLPIVTARIEVGDQAQMLEPDGNQQSFTAKMELSAGPIELKTTFFDKDSKEICGAYYVYVKRE